MSGVPGPAEMARRVKMATADDRPPTRLDGPGGSRRVTNTPPDMAPFPADRAESNGHQPNGSSQDADAPNQATALVDLARKHYRLLRDEDGENWAIPVDGPNVAIPMGRGGHFGNDLLLMFYEQEGKVPSDQAERQAEKLLRAQMYLQDPEPVHLRVARDGNRIILDLATSNGSCVIITKDGWEVADKSPVPFQRGQCRPLPRPVRNGGGRAKLRGLVNANDDQFMLCVAWLVSALYPGIPHPIILPRGENGSAKTAMTRTLQQIIDPSGLEPGALPESERDLAVAMGAAYVQAFDNISFIPNWCSDALCRAATGAAYRTRTLYTNRGITVLRYIRPIVINTIAPGALNADLIERSAPMDLERIPPEKRRPERTVIGADVSKSPGVRDSLDRDHAAILGWILDLLSAVLKHAPDVTLDKYPRMADHGVVLAALDKELGWDSFGLYMALVEDEIGALIENSAFAMALLDYMKENEGEWRATATEIRKTLTGRLPDKDKLPEGWPKDAARAGVQLRRFAATLRVYGIDADFDREGKKRTKTWIIQKLPSAPSAPSANGSDLGKQADGKDPCYRPPDESTVRQADGNSQADGRRTVTTVRPLTSENNPKKGGADGADGNFRKNTHTDPAQQMADRAADTDSDDDSWVRDAPGDLGNSAGDSPVPADSDPSSAGNGWPGGSNGATANPPGKLRNLRCPHCNYRIKTVVSAGEMAYCKRCNQEFPAP